MDVTPTDTVLVHLLDLGAGLSAYIDSLSAITALRLCNRFGKGNTAFIKRLPMELVQTIEGYIVRKVPC